MFMGKKIKDILIEYVKEKLFKVIHSKDYYSSYQDIFYVGTYDECVNFIVKSRDNMLEILPYGDHTIEEGISIEDDKIKIDYNKNDEDDNINTRLGKSSKNIKFEPRITTLKNSRTPVLSVYNKISNKDTTEIIKDIKSKKSDRKYGVTDEDYETFINRTAIFYGKYLKNQDIDTIFVMESKSSLAEDLTMRIKSILPDTTIKILKKSIVKNIENLTLDKEGVKIYDTEFKILTDFYNKVKNTGEFSVKKIHPKHRSLFKNWIKINEDSIRYITNKNVLIIDDYITSGSTLDEVCTQILKLSPKSLKCLTIIK